MGNKSEVPWDEKMYASIQEILVYYMMTSRFEVSKTMESLNFEIYQFLKTYDYSDREITDYLSFNLKVDKKEEYVEVKPLNLVSALWFCNVFPKDLPDIDATEMIVDDKNYTLKKYKLKITNAKKYRNNHR